MLVGPLLLPPDRDHPGGVLPLGTVVDSVLRWSGSAWVEETSLLVSAAGDMTQTAASPANVHGDGTGSPRSTWLKGAAGDILHRLKVTSTADKAGDWQHGLNSLEAWILQYYDGSQYRTNIYTYDDRNIIFLGDAQGSATVTVGNSVAVAATDESYLHLRSGTAGAPAVWFTDSGNALLWDENGQNFQHYIAGTLYLLLTPSVLRLGNSVDLTVETNGVSDIGETGTRFRNAFVGALDCTGVASAATLEADGDSGGLASTTRISNVTTGTAAGAVTLVQSSTALNVTNAGWLKLYVGTTAVYVPYFTASP